MDNEECVSVGFALQPCAKGTIRWRWDFNTEKNCFHFFSYDCSITQERSIDFLSTLISKDNEDDDDDDDENNNDDSSEGKFHNILARPTYTSSTYDFMLPVQAVKRAISLDASFFDTEVMQIILHLKPKVSWPPQSRTAKAPEFCVIHFEAKNTRLTPQQVEELKALRSEEHTSLLEEPDFVEYDDEEEAMANKTTEKEIQAILYTSISNAIRKYQLANTARITSLCFKAIEVVGMGTYKGAHSGIIDELAMAFPVITIERDADTCSEFTAIKAVPPGCKKVMRYVFESKYLCLVQLAKNTETTETTKKKKKKRKKAKTNSIAFEDLSELAILVIHAPETEYQKTLGILYFIQRNQKFHVLKDVANAQYSALFDNLQEHTSVIVMISKLKHAEFRALNLDALQNVTREDVIAYHSKTLNVDEHTNPRAHIHKAILALDPHTVTRNRSFADRLPPPSPLNEDDLIEEGSVYEPEETSDDDEGEGEGEEEKDGVYGMQISSEDDLSDIMSNDNAEGNGSYGAPYACSDDGSDSESDSYAV